MSSHTFLFDQVGSIPYCSPEIFHGEPYNQKVDVWALGCIIYEMVTKKLAFSGSNEEQIKSKIVNGYIPKIPENSISKEIIEIYDRCMKQKQTDRPTIAELLAIDSIQDMARRVNIHLPVQAARKRSFFLQESINFSRLP